MDFIVKSMQLSIEKFIKSKQDANTLPTRAAVFIDLTNMFNSVSRDELFDIIRSDFPELTNLTELLYNKHGNVYYKWKNVKWKTLFMEEGVNQGCPLSPIFATLVLQRALKPIDDALKQQAIERTNKGNLHDDNHGGVSHQLGYMDDILALIPLEDIKFYCEKIKSKIGCFVNPYKTRILTSCNGTSIIQTLRSHNPTLAQELEETINKFSIKQDKNNIDIPVELTQGFRLLGTPVG
jgi:hypothetical protein